MWSISSRCGPVRRARADAQDYWRIFQRKLETVKEGKFGPAELAFPTE